jgi:hypothetical protein
MLKIYKAAIFYIFYWLTLYPSHKAQVATAGLMEFSINLIGNRPHNLNKLHVSNKKNGCNDLIIIFLCTARGIC